MELSQLRWLEFEQATASISMPLLSILTLWLAVLFVSFGLFSPVERHRRCHTDVSALSVSGAIFLILELDRPFDVE